MEDKGEDGRCQGNHVGQEDVEEQGGRLEKDVGEESRKIKLEMEVEREEKVMARFWVLEMRRGSRDEGNDNEEFDTILVSL